MNLSLKNRVAASFILANLVIIVLGLTVFHFLDTLNRNIERITMDANRVTLLTDEIRISAVSILKYQRKIVVGKTTPDVIEKMIALCEGFTAQLQTLDTLYQGVEVKQVIAKMLGYVDSLQVVLRKASTSVSAGGVSSATSNNNGNPSSASPLNMAVIAASISSIGELADKILEAFSEFQDVQYFQSAERDKKVKNIIRKTKRNMMYTLIITFVGTMLLGLVVPGRMALPFKKINDAIRELQSSNFDVSIYYNHDDEIGEMANEINKMIVSLKKFEELRAEKILLEGRKFDALANMVKKYIMVSNAKGELIYLNNYLYSLLQLQSDDVLYKGMRDTRIPDAIIEAYELAIKRRSKLENIEISIPHNRGAAAKDEIDLIDQEGPQLLFQGYANIIPIRGKESSLDYYLMILSVEMLV